MNGSATACRTTTAMVVSRTSQAHARHIGLYAFSQEDARAVGLEEHMAAKSTLQFPLDQPLPLAAIRKLIEQRVTTSEAKGGASS
jgi:hypothetical protein